MSVRVCAGLAPKNTAKAAVGIRAEPDRALKPGGLPRARLVQGISGGCQADGLAGAGAVCGAGKYFGDW